MRGDPARRIVMHLWPWPRLVREGRRATDGSKGARRRQAPPCRPPQARGGREGVNSCWRGGSGEMISEGLLATMSLAGLLAGLMTIGANAQTASLSGKVSSAEEGLVEGVLISAKKEGATITTTVVSNAKGEFSFPADRIEP